MRSSFLPKCKPKITRISALPNKQGSQPKQLPRLPKNNCYDPCLFSRAEILVILGLHFGRTFKVSSFYHLCVECFSQLSFDSEVYTKSAAVAYFVYTSESNESCEKHSTQR